MPRGMLRETLRLGWIRFHPPSYWRYYVWKRGLAEPEIALLPALCTRDGVSLDIGANIGLYSNALLAVSGRCIAFEPLPPMAALLKKGFRRAGERFRVERVALSDRPGTATLRMPKGDFGYTTMEPDNALEGKVDTKKLVTFDVETRQLDDYALDDVRFVKIDVEGHEESVLRGGRETLRRCRPSVLVEVEECHKAGAVAAVEGFMRGLGYECFFLEEGRLRRFAEFDLARHQDKAAPASYVRNFLFLCDDARSRVEETLAGLRSSRD
jgi:FkbM family methyltransferase